MPDMENDGESASMFDALPHTGPIDRYEHKFLETPAEWESVGAIYWKPEPGDILIGVYDGSIPFEEGDFDLEVQKHFIITHDFTRYSFVGGSVFDQTQRGAGIRPGDMVRIKYIGQTTGGKGRVNLFDVRVKRKP